MAHLFTLEHCGIPGIFYDPTFSRLPSGCPSPPLRWTRILKHFFLFCFGLFFTVVDSSYCKWEQFYKEHVSWRQWHGLSPREMFRSVGHVFIYACVCTLFVALTNMPATCGNRLSLPGQTKVQKFSMLLAKSNSCPPTQTNLLSSPPGFTPLALHLYFLNHFRPFPSLTFTPCLSLPSSLPRPRCGLHRRMWLN